MSFLIAGFIGGVLRGAVGLVKYITSYKDVEIRPYYFISSVLLAGLIGYVAAWVIKDIAHIFVGIETAPVSFALIAGYAGGDLIENLFKIGMKEPNLFEIGKKIKEITSLTEKKK